MFSPADAHLAICNRTRLPGREATIRVANCACVIAKALREGDHHALLLPADFSDNSKAAKLGVWPEALLLRVDLELQLAVPTTVYHWLEALHDLSLRGRLDRQIRLAGVATGRCAADHHPQPPARTHGAGPDASAPGRAPAPHTVQLANLPSNAALETSVRKSVGPNAARGATEPTKCPLCALARLDRRRVDHVACHLRATGLPALRGLAAGTHPGLLHGGGPLAPGGPAAQHVCPKQAAGSWVGQPTDIGLEPRPGGTPVGRITRRRHSDQGRPRPPCRTHHARPPSSYPGGSATWAAEPERVRLHVQPGGHLAICNRKRLPGREATIRVANCACVIAKALREGDHDALVLPADLRDHSKAAKPGVWLEVLLLRVDLELQLAVPTTVYHWLEALHDLSLRGRLDRRISPTDWQERLRADAQHTTIRSLWPAPMVRAPTHRPLAVRRRLTRSSSPTCPATRHQKPLSASQ